MIQKTIIQYIENMLDKLKAKNGLVWGILMLVLVAIYAIGKYLESSGNITGIVLPAGAITYMDYVLAIIAAITGAHTKSNNDSTGNK